VLDVCDFFHLSRNHTISDFQELRSAFLSFVVYFARSHDPQNANQEAHTLGVHTQNIMTIAQFTQSAKFSKCRALSPAAMGHAQRY
jgi:hypothetical protein